MKPAKLPFDLKESDLAKVEIGYHYHSQKTGAGIQEIVVSGTGKIQLRKTMAAREKPEVKEGQAGAGEIAALLALMEEENFLGLEDEYTIPPPHHGYRKIWLNLPSGPKTVMLFSPVNNAVFERVAGAVKLMAGTALPPALGHRFFPNL